MGVQMPTNSEGPSYLPAVLALCAANAPGHNSTNRNSSRARGRTNKKGNQSNFPLNTPGCSRSTDKDLKSSLSDSPLPIPLHCPPLAKRKLSDFLDNYPPTTFRSPEPDVQNVHPPSSMSSLPNLNLPAQEEFQVPPTSSFGRKPNTSPLFPEIRRNILEDIAARYRLGAGRLLQGMPNVNWSREEINSLWLGVGRYGADNWDAILGDPGLEFSKMKYPNQLALKWEEELLNAYSPMTRSGGPINAHKNFASHWGILPENHDPFQSDCSETLQASVCGNLWAKSSSNHGSHGSGFLPFNRPSEHGIQLEHELYARKHQKVSSHMNHTRVFSHGFSPPFSFPPHLRDRPNLSSLKGKEIETEDSSMKEPLPHWFPKTQDLERPSTASITRESRRPADPPSPLPFQPIVTPSTLQFQPNNPQNSMIMIGASPTDIARSTQDVHGGSSSRSLASRSISMFPSMLNQMPRK